ncbi:AMP-binding protein [Deltaproteobacteria bacterium IMCC39524]|nr:AMP-binding protein [Deltaproteobacteria bacterium IMCC39524]
MYYFNLGSLFAEVVSGNPACPALRYPEGDVRYADLQATANQLAQLLLDKGCQRGDVIAIGHTKKTLSYALMLAGLKLGIPYVNVDVTSPVARNARIIAVSNPRLIFFDDMQFASSMQELSETSSCDAIYLDGEVLPQLSVRQLENQERLLSHVDGACIAYIMFTSGSTGDPKGVAVTHQNVLHFIEWGQKRFDVSTQTNFANLSPMYFDNSVFDFYVGLFSGACLSPVPRELMTSPYELVEHVGKMQCNLWFSVPSLLIYLTTMKAMKANSMSALRCIVFGGEGYPKTELKKLYDEFSAQAMLVNVYGPTECTCICSAYDIVQTDFDDMQGLPTLGHLNQNFDYRILDEEENASDCGELCLIGPNVASGYFNDLERTSAAFYTLTEPNRYMKRMYRTGDLVKEIDGRLYFNGRKDNQIKHMGYRIELEEIEHALVKLPQVNQAAAVYQRGNVTHGKIIGFVACQGSVEEEELLACLANFLPDYMIPSKIVVVEVLPKNPNGKVDRQQLKALI